MLDDDAGGHSPQGPAAGVTKAVVVDAGGGKGNKGAPAARAHAHAHVHVHVQVMNQKVLPMSSERASRTQSVGTRVGSF